MMARASRARRGYLITTTELHGISSAVGKVNNVYCSTAGISQVLAQHRGALWVHHVLGILISVFLNTFHEADTRISAVSIPTFKLESSAKDYVGTVGITSATRQSAAESDEQ